MKELIHKLHKPIHFGKYNGRILKWVIDNDEKWVRWSLQNIDWFRIEQKAMMYLNAGKSWATGKTADSKKVSAPPYTGEGKIISNGSPVETFPFGYFEPKSCEDCKHENKYSTVSNGFTIIKCNDCGQNLSK